MISEYQVQANRFATKHDVKLRILDESYGRYFPDDKKKRSIFKCELIRRFYGQPNDQRYYFTFGQSISLPGGKPTMYDILACMTKCDPGNFEEFCSEFGYDDEKPFSYSRVMKTYRAVVREYSAMKRLFADVMEELQEIS